MKNWILCFRALALVALALAATSGFGQADYSTPYTISKWAGVTSIAGANDGTINYAQLSLPIGTAFDASGNLYVADSGNDTIRKISPTGISTTFAGAAGSEGVNDGTGSNARFKTPSGVAIDGGGTIYVSDTANHTIRKISAAGAVTTLAGSAGNSGTADGTGTAARFNNPIGLALTAAGELLVADSNNHTIRKVTSAGVVTTFAGAAGNAGAADGSGTGATFRNPHSLTVDAAGNIFVSDSGNHTIRKITAAGVVSTFAGSAGSSGSADGSGGAARFNSPQGLAVDSGGNLFVADAENNLLRKISAAGAVTTFAGALNSPRSADGTGTDARFQKPSALVFDSNGTLYVSDYLNNTIRKTTSAAAVTTWIGSPPRAGSANGIGAAGLFNNPYGIAVDSSRNLYLADTFNHTIRKISATGTVSTLAGLAGASGFADATGSAARFNYPYGIAVDAAGNVYVADKNNNAIRKITAAGVVTTFAGSTTGTGGNADGTGTAARFLSPYGVAVDSTGSVYVADYGSSTIRKITSAGVVTTLAGQAFSFASADGTGSAARFFGPSALAVDGSGNIFVADAGNSTVRKVTAAGVVTTLAGLAGTAGNKDGSGTAAQFTAPAAVAVDATGNIFVVDFTSNVIRLINPAGIVKTIAGTANTRGSDDGIGAAVQFADPTGIAVDSLGEIYIVDSSNALIRRGLPPGAANFSAQPASQATALGQSVTLSVSASGSGVSYQWQKDGVSISGAVSSNYTIASPQTTDAGSYSVLVTAGGITAVSMPATLSVGSTVSNNAINITIQPASQSVSTGQSVTFTVVATGTGLTYQWQKNGGAIAGATSSSYNIPSAQASDAASYTVFIASGNIATTSAAAVLTVGASSGPTARITNLSILTSLTSAGDSFTLGYVVGNSSASNPISLVIRAAGPALGALGYPGTMADPKLETFAGSTKTGENDNWGGTPALVNAFASVGAFAWTTPTSKDAATVGSITTRDNSVKVTAADNGTGAVIAEVYDATPSGNFNGSSPRLINVSVLKPIGTSLTVGFVVGGTGTKTVLIRALGPTLATLFGFPASAVIADPRLELFNGASQSIGTNDNWGGTAALSAAFVAAGTFGLDGSSLDACMVATLSPGNHTVVVTPSTGATGTGLVEVYELP